MNGIKFVLMTKVIFISLSYMLKRNVLIILFTFSVSSFLYSQNKETRVLISEKKTGKRIVLFAENTTKDTLNIFFMVTPTGFRRSASRPLIKDLLPYKKVPLLTLIKIDGVTSSYEYSLIINEEERNVTVGYKKEVESIENVIYKKLVLFFRDDCEKCKLLFSALEKQHIQYRKFNIDQNQKLYNQFLKFISKRYPEKEKVRLPVIWNKEYVLLGFDNLETLLKELE